MIPAIGTMIAAYAIARLLQIPIEQSTHRHKLVLLVAISLISIVLIAISAVDLMMAGLSSADLFGQ